MKYNKKGQFLPAEKGHEFMSRDDVVVKNDENKWVLKKWHVYESVYGKQKNKRIVFLDGNHQNITIENMVAVSIQVLAILSSKKMLTEYPEITRSNILVAEIIAARKNLKKKIKA